MKAKNFFTEEFDAIDSRDKSMNILLKDYQKKALYAQKEADRMLDAILQNKANYIELTIKQVEHFGIVNGFPFNVRFVDNFSDVISVWGCEIPNEEISDLQGKTVKVIKCNGTSVLIDGFPYWVFSGFIDGRSLYELNDSDEEI